MLDTLNYSPDRFAIVAVSRLPSGISSRNDKLWALDNGFQRALEGDCGVELDKPPRGSAFATDKECRQESLATTRLPLPCNITHTEHGLVRLVFKDAMNVQNKTL